MNDINKTYRYIDPATNRKKRIATDALSFNEGFPVFSFVEFNIYGNCNRSCRFCPVSNRQIYNRKTEGIKIELYKKIMQDLSDFDYRGAIFFSGFSEPLLHERVTDLISLSKEMIPEARLEIFSNGDKIKNNKKHLLELFEAGLDTINLSIYDGPEAMYYFDKMIRHELELTHNQVVLRRRYYKKGNLGMSISNRSGLVDSNIFRDKDEDPIDNLPIMSPCFYPFYLIFVDYNGNVLLCPNDWGKRFIVGNLGENHILNLWKNEKIENARMMLANKNRCFIPCQSCDVKGDVMGRTSFSAWKAWKERFYE